MKTGRDDNPKKFYNKGKWFLSWPVEVKLLSEEAKGIVKVDNLHHLFAITILKKVRAEGLVSFYSTDVEIKPPAGYILETVNSPRLLELGFRTLDSYPLKLEGEVEIPLLKINDDAELELPNNAVWVVMRKVYNCNLAVATTYKPKKTKPVKGGRRNRDD